MGQIKVTKNPIEGLYVIEPIVHGDSRGYFVGSYNQNDIHEAGLDMMLVLDNQIKSTRGVMCDLHFQKKFPQKILVRVILGSVFDVAVDLLSDSETYGKWYGEELTTENKKQFYNSENFVNGFLVQSDEAEYCHKVSKSHNYGDEGGLAWNNPEIGIDWLKLKGNHKEKIDSEGYFIYGVPMNLSDKDKDKEWLRLKENINFVSREGNNKDERKN